MSTHLGKCTEKTAPVYGDTVFVDFLYGRNMIFKITIHAIFWGNSRNHIVDTLEGICIIFVIFRHYYSTKRGLVDL